jgi:hypothetical protein
MSQIGKPVKVHENVPEPQVAPAFVPVKEPVEVPAWLDPNKVPVRVKR